MSPSPEWYCVVCGRRFTAAEAKALEPVEGVCVGTDEQPHEGYALASLKRTSGGSKRNGSSVTPKAGGKPAARKGGKRK